VTDNEQKSRQREQKVSDGLVEQARSGDTLDRPYKRLAGKVALRTPILRLSIGHRSFVKAGHPR
jgi:hypothetical protein